MLSKETYKSIEKFIQEYLNSSKKKSPAMIWAIAKLIESITF
ncbi:hypothetical protein [Enterococcus faecalis]|nr:hypothetical protein [Enterococcus faecalis]MDN3093767.1 hypothetical protein [Enterococcus faecalis]